MCHVKNSVLNKCRVKQGMGRQVKERAAFRISSVSVADLSSLYLIYHCQCHSRLLSSVQTIPQSLHKHLICTVLRSLVQHGG